ncbi:MAG: serine/threonine protein kinase, partial [Kangiellaceae bacterium]|nr:serine/threonine protein kinase [Kangiellaceae bacterium]
MSAIEIPGYKIIKTLGVGGQATVYLAIQQGFDREVALKIMSPALAADPTFGERFLREAKIVAKLSHARIVTVYDVGESGSFYYLAMEYMRGKDLKDQIANGLKTKQALVIIARLAQALHFAHKKGYIHRDVKSENILFDDDNQPVLTDFGIAKASNSATQMTQTGKLIGTPEYMSPEQCRGRKLDGRSDLYSLGIILFEMLARTVPFTGEDSVSVCIQHVTKPVPQLPARLGHLQWLIDSLLAKKASNRFQTGKELAEAIQSFLKDGQKAPVKMNAVREDVTRTDLDIPSDGFDEQSFELNDNFEVNRRIEVMPESSGLISKIVFVLLFAILVGAGYQYRTDWVPEAQQLLGVNWFDSKELAPSGLSTNQQTGSQSIERLSSEKKTRAASQASTSKQEGVEPVSNATTNNQVTDLIKKASTLAQYMPHELSDIKHALDNLTRAKSIAPNNENVGSIKKTIISIALKEADNFSEQDKYNIAEQWLELVESADHFNEDLAELKETVATRRYNYSQEIT